MPGPSDIAAVLVGDAFPVTEHVRALVILAFAALLVWAALSDLRRFVIPNTVSLALVGLWVVWLVVAPDRGPDLVDAGLVAGAVFAIGLVLFHVGVMGGGDVKLITVLALWAGPVGTIVLVAHVAIAGGVLSILWLTPLRLRLAPVLGWGAEERERRHVPYGVAIAAGGLVLAARLLTA